MENILVVNAVNYTLTTSPAGYLINMVSAPAHVLSITKQEIVLSMSRIGGQGSQGLNILSLGTDVDTTDLVDGSILVYSTDTSKWVSTILLGKQTIEAGQY